MCISLVNAFEEILEYPYIPKTAGRTVEGEVAGVIATHLGCSVIEKPSGTGTIDKPKGKTGERYYAKLRSMVKPYIILQPEGSQQAPDIRLVMPSETLDIECKRSESGQAMWNSGRPRSNNIYILNSKNKKLMSDNTTFCLGSAFIDVDTEIEMEVMLTTLKRLKESINNTTLQNAMFELQHLRPMYKEKDSASTYWLEHPSRWKREAEVLKYVATL